MLLELFLAIIIGVLIGTLTGLSPGIHINLVAAFLLSSLFLLNTINPIFLVIFIISMSITHTFVDFIPSIFLGAPNEDSSLSVLPGHRMLLKGYGYKAVILTLYGSLAGILITLIFTPLFIKFLPKIYENIKLAIPFILILSSLFLIFTEKHKSKAFFIFILAGILGIVSLNLNLKDPLLPLFTGLFGASNLIISIKNKIIIPRQRIIPLKKIKLSKYSLLRTNLAAFISSPLCCFLPGLGSSQAAVIGSSVAGNLNKSEFLYLIGAINTIVMALSFVTLYVINKSRTGAALAVSKLLQISSNDLILILIAIIFSGILAFFISIAIAKIFSRIIYKINYSIISLAVLFILLIFTIIFSGFIGLIVFITSTFLGILCALLKIKRIHLMGCLIIPTIIFYLI